MIDEIALKLQESNQKHHRLKLQLETSKLENETVVHDLRSDIADLQRQHEEELKRIRQREKGNLDTIQELTIQNERLADQVLHVGVKFPTNSCLFFFMERGLFVLNAADRATN